MNLNHTVIEEENNESGSGSNVYAAVCHSQNILGVACYNELQNSITADIFEFSSEDAESSLNFIKICVNPTLFLLHPNVAANSPLFELIVQGIDGTANYYEHKATRTSSWNEKYAQNTLYNNLKIRSSSIENDCGSIDTYRKLSSSVPIDKVQLRQALGALVCYIQEVVFHLDQGKVVVNTVNPFPMNSYMKIDTNTYRALQIFKEDMHPNWIKGKGRSKEGFSLFGLFDRTSSVIGRKKLREWMLTPYYHMDRILERQRGVSFAADESNRELISNIGRYLHHVYDIPKLLLRIKKVEATYSEWCKLYHSLIAGVSILDCFYDYTHTYKYASAENVSFIQEFCGNIDGHSIRLLIQKMNSVIDFALSEKNREIVVKEGFDSLLDEKRDIYENLEGYLVSVAQSLLDQYSMLNVSIV